MLESGGLSGRHRCWKTLSMSCFGAEQSRIPVSGHPGCMEPFPSSPSPSPGPVAAQSLSFKESLKSQRQEQKAPAAASLDEDSSAQSNNLEIICACLQAASAASTNLSAADSWTQTGTAAPSWCLSLLFGGSKGALEEPPFLFCR